MTGEIKGIDDSGPAFNEKRMEQEQKKMEKKVKKAGQLTKVMMFKFIAELINNEKNKHPPEPLPGAFRRGFLQRSGIPDFPSVP